MKKTNSIQLKLPVEMDQSFPCEAVINSRGVGPGQKVLYTGNVKGGPSTGSSGIVKKLYANKAVVDLGILGIWNVPYYFLGKPVVIGAA
ncbi:MAG: hypothetical protein VX478_06825 [Chloroflexota bacterium]|nr:hypothetical protein [Chloroflexota bacterium]|tara:strand:- start:32 stop:298 length:267 start_codon:yes stop_codon:yes gene_type:complete